ncbi:MAG: hypothetical protein NVSMB48_01790 [Marmoricola sp.]
MKRKTIAAGFAVCIAVLPILSGCGSAQELSLNGASAPSKPPLPNIDTTNLSLAISPTSGPVGTPVTVTISGCGDASGENHALSYNAGDVSAHSPEAATAIQSIASPLTNGGVKTSFAIPLQTSSIGVFYFQCGTALQSAAFSVTK